MERFYPGFYADKLTNARYEVNKENYSLTFWDSRWFSAFTFAYPWKALDPLTATTVELNRSVAVVEMDDDIFLASVLAEETGEVIAYWFDPNGATLLLPIIDTRYGERIKLKAAEHVKGLIIPSPEDRETLVIRGRGVPGMDDSQPAAPVEKAWMKDFEDTTATTSGTFTVLPLPSGMAFHPSMSSVEKNTWGNVPTKEELADELDDVRKDLNDLLGELASMEKALRALLKHD